MKMNEYHYSVKADLVVMAENQEEAESKMQSARTRLEWTLNNVEVEHRDTLQVEPQNFEK